MIRILVVETTVFGYDGITNVMTNYYTYMNHDKIHMDIITINPVSDKFKLELENRDSKYYVLPYRNSNPFRYAYELIKILKKGEYSAIHVHGCSATMAVEIVAAKVAGVKVRIAHSHNTVCDHVKVDKLLRPVFDRVCNVGFACGREAGEWLFPNKQFSVISNGIDLEKFQYNETIRKQFRSRYGLEGKSVIGHVGRFSKQKNHRKLMEIFAEYSKNHKNAILVLVGDGELRSNIEKHAEREKLNVMFVGLSDEVEKWLQAMDVVVFPSLYEGLPLGLVEAQAAGLPCVLSDTISSATRITDLVRFVGLNDSADVWVSAIDDMLLKADRATQKKSVMEAIQDARFDIRKNCEELSDKYLQLVAGNDRR